MYKEKEGRGMNLAMLRELVDLAYTLNFSETASRLYISQPTLSHHMKVLCDCGIVRCRREGRWRHYSVDSQVATGLASFFAGLTAPDAQQEGCPCDGCKAGA